MLTLFATCKPFRGENEVHQRNAIQSWKRLHPDCQVLLFGDEPGVAEISRELALEHVPEPRRGEHGYPLLDHMFRAARERARHEILCFACADIILLDDWLGAVRRTRERFPQFLLCGRRRPAKVERPIDFRRPDWASPFRGLPLASGHFGLDVSAFPKSLFADMPPFAVGHFMWDSWMVYRCRRGGIPVVDAQEDATVVHQEHARRPWDIERLNPVERRNLELAGGRERMLGSCDATYLLRGGRVLRARSWRHYRRMLDTAPVLHPWTRPLLWPLQAALTATRSLRRRLGLVLPP